MYLVCHNTPRIRRDLPQLSGYPKVVLHITSISSEIIDIISQSAVTAAGNSNESVPCSHQIWAEDSEVPASIWFCVISPRPPTTRSVVLFELFQQRNHSHLARGSVRDRPEVARVYPITPSASPFAISCAREQGDSYRIHRHNNIVPSSSGSGHGCDANCAIRRGGVVPKGLRSATRWASNALFWLRPPRLT